jgi:glycosyltransferase involved in cell wall biosynthesis
VSKLRVLLVTETCDPEGRAGFLIGWLQAAALRRRLDVHIVTETANRAPLLRAGLTEGVDFTIVDATAPKRLRDRIRDTIFGRDSERGWGLWQALSLPAVALFEWRVWRRFRRDLRRGRYDVVHRLTPISPDQPSVLATRLPATGVPLVIGPLNGGLPWPAGYDHVRQAEGEWMSYLRGLTRLVPGLSALRANAAALLLGSRAMVEANPPQFHDRAIYLPENGIDPTRFSVRRSRAAALPLRLVYLGRLVPYKGPDLVVEAAAALLARGDASLRIVGSGPLRDTLEAQVRALGVDHAVTFVGDVDHVRVQEELAEADLLCAPSIREFGGAVVMEAMYMGVVPVVVDYGGPPEYVSTDCAFVLPIGPREAIVADLRAVLTGVAADPATLHAMAAAGQVRARGVFEWDAKARMIEQVYRWALGQVPVKPNFGMPLSLAAVAALAPSDTHADGAKQRQDRHEP